MQNIKQTIGFIAGIMMIGLALSGVMPPKFYLSFGLVFGLLVGVFEYSAFMVRIKAEVYDEHNLAPSRFIYAPIAFLNVVFWGFTLSIYIMNSLEGLAVREQ